MADNLYILFTYIQVRTNVSRIGKTYIQIHQINNL